jgi:hypothetical protein
MTLCLFLQRAWAVLQLQGCTRDNERRKKLKEAEVHPDPDLGRDLLLLLHCLVLLTILKPLWFNMAIPPSIRSRSLKCEGIAGQAVVVGSLIGVAHLTQQMAVGQVGVEVGLVRWLVQQQLVELLLWLFQRPKNLEQAAEQNVNEDVSVTISNIYILLIIT